MNYVSRNIEKWLRWHWYDIYGCDFTFDYGILDRAGKLETVLRSGFINDDMAYEYFTIEEIEQMEWNSWFFISKNLYEKQKIWR